MEVKINISEEDIQQHVREESAYIGAKLLDVNPGAYEKLAALEEDSDLLHTFFDEGIGSICDASENYYPKKDDGGIVLTDVPGNFRKDTEQLDEAVKKFIFGYVMSRWLDTCGMSEKSKEYLATAGTELQNYSVLLTWRNYPSRVN